MPDALKERFGERLKENEPLAKHVNFRVGGPARFWLVAKSSDEIAEAARAAHEDGLKWVMLGSGSNVLPSDNGFDGLVIQAANRGWTIESNVKGQKPALSEAEGSKVKAEAGVPSAFLARKTAEAGLTGFEWAVSLPGTVGGAVRGNAGCFGGEMKDVVETVDAMRIEESDIEVSGSAPVPDSSIQRVRLTNKECRFGYRDSVFKHSTDIVLSATLRLEEAPKEECLARIEKVLAARKEEQPQAAACAGCLFKNFEYKDESMIEKLLEREDVPEGFLKARRIPAGWLIDRAGLKGACSGKACVSEKHANFLVSDGATADDIVQLISRIKTRIRDRYGIQLDEEVQYLGF